MIFATVGTQLPFPRLITLLDRIAGRHGLDMVAQTCDAEARPEHLTAHAQLDPKTFDELVARASLIVGHAGIGTILCAGRSAKPLILFPRRASFGEHRNEHQLATVASLEGREGIYIARTDEELEELLLRPSLLPLKMGNSIKSAPLIARLRDFIAS
jgi:UDP-N-acetylglucosamine transferase subunit ALG13